MRPIDAPVKLMAKLWHTALRGRTSPMASSNLDQNAHFGGHPSKKGLAKPRPLMESRQRSSKLQSSAKLRRSSMKIRATSLAGPLNANPHCCCLRLELKNRVASKKLIRLNLYTHVRSLANTWAKRKAVIPINIYHKTVQIFKWPPLQNLKMLTVVSSNQSRYQNKTNSKKNSDSYLGTLK